MTDSVTSGTPYLFWAIGIVVLGAIVVFSILRNRRRSASPAVTDEATRQVYREEQRDPANNT